MRTINRIWVVATLSLLGYQLGYAQCTGTATLSVSFCKDSYEPNQTQSTASSVGVGSSFTGFANTFICPATDEDWFSFYTTPTKRKVTVELKNLPANYNFQIYNAAGTVVGSSTNTGTTNEYWQNTNLAVGNYSVRIYGVSGAYSASQAYLLTMAIQNSTATGGTKTPIGVASISNSLLRINDEGVAFQMYPNPASSEVSLQWDANNEGDITIRFIDLMGRTVWQKQQSISAGSSISTVSTQDLPSGVYTVEVFDGENLYTEKLIISR